MLMKNTSALCGARVVSSVLSASVDLGTRYLYVGNAGGGIRGAFLSRNTIKPFLSTSGQSHV